MLSRVYLALANGLSCIFLLPVVWYDTATNRKPVSKADMWKRCSHPAESVEFCIQRYFDMLSSKIVRSKRSDEWIGRHLEFQCQRSFGTQDTNVQRFVMAAILEFKMVADPLVRPLKSDNFWTQHVKIPLYAKFHTFCRMRTSRPIFDTYLPH